MSMPWDRFTPDAPEAEPELPWDRFTPDEPEPVPAPPPAPAPVPAPIPIPQPPPSRPPIDTDIVGDALDALWPELKEKAVTYVQDSFSEIRKGHTVDVLHPTVTAETATGRELVVADAKSRSWRTLIQGLIFDVFAAIVAAVALLSGADPFVKETWIAFGVLLLKSVVSAVISYVMRITVQPTIKTPGHRMNVMPVPTRIEEEEDLP